MTGADEGARHRVGAPGGAGAGEQDVVGQRAEERHAPVDVSLTDWPDAAPLQTARLVLVPLSVDHAEEVAEALDDPGLHTFTGGTPASADQLRARYRRQVAGRSPDGSQRWANWVLRRREDGRAVGTVQATIAEEHDALVAEVAWVVATVHQGRGCAQEAASAVVRWLREHGVVRLVAHIHPEHRASQGVARALGLGPSTTVVDGEVRWRT